MAAQDALRALSESVEIAIVTAIRGGATRQQVAGLLEAIASDAEHSDALWLEMCQGASDGN